jgi:hypothetical protein
MEQFIKSSGMVEAILRTPARLPGKDGSINAIPALKHPTVEIPI